MLPSASITTSPLCAVTFAFTTTFPAVIPTDSAVIPSSSVSFPYVWFSVTVSVTSATVKPLPPSVPTSISAVPFSTTSLRSVSAAMTPAPFTVAMPSVYEMLPLSTKTRLPSNDTSCAPSTLPDNSLTSMCTDFPLPTEIFSPLSIASVPFLAMYAALPPIVPVALTMMSPFADSTYLSAAALTDSDSVIV